jgi:hypothetical protein
VVLQIKPFVLVVFLIFGYRFCFDRHYNARVGTFLDQFYCTPTSTTFLFGVTMKVYKFVEFSALQLLVGYDTRYLLHSLLCFTSSYETIAFLFIIL